MCCDAREMYITVGSVVFVAYCFPPCQNGGRCYRPGLCACPSGWTGSRCQTRESGCTLHQYPSTNTEGHLCNMLLSLAVCSPSCQNGGTCTSPGRCTCTRGWTGTSCENCKPANNYNTYTCVIHTYNNNATQ